LKTVFYGDWSKNGGLMSWQGSASHHKKRLAAGRLKMEFLQVWRLAGVASSSGHFVNDIGNIHRFVYCLVVEKRWKPCQCQSGFLNSRQKGSNCPIIAFLNHCTAKCQYFLHI